MLGRWILRSPAKRPDETVYSVRHCVDTHTIFVAAPDYLEFDKVYTMEEIAALPLILLERKASSRVYVERYFQDHGVQIHPEIELGSHNLLISLARIGLGVACVTEEFSLSGLSRGVIVPLKTVLRSRRAPVTSVPYRASRRPRRPIASWTSSPRPTAWPMTPAIPTISPIVDTK